jgi:hydrogenase maturation factor
MSEVGESCITCGDVAVVLQVVSVDGGDAVCRADDGGTERVAVELVAPVREGDRVLVHAKVALEKLERLERLERLESGAAPVLGRERRSASAGAANNCAGGEWRGRGTL